MGVRVSVGPEGSLDFFGLADQQRPESKFHSSVFEWVEDRGLYLSQKEIFSCPSSPIFSCFVVETLVFQLWQHFTIFGGGQKKRMFRDCFYMLLVTPKRPEVK